MLHAEEDALDVDGEDRVVGRDIDVGDADHRQGRAGVVDEAVHPAEARNRMRDHRLDVVFFGDVGPNEADAEPPFERRAFVLAAGRDNDLGAFLDENLGDPFADPAGRAGDDGDLSAQSIHARSPCRSMRDS